MLNKLPSFYLLHVILIILMLYHDNQPVQLCNCMNPATCTNTTEWKINRLLLKLSDLGLKYDLPGPPVAD